MVPTDLSAKRMSARFLSCKGLLSPFGIRKYYAGWCLETVSMSSPSPANYPLWWFLPKSIFTLMEPNGFLTPLFLDDSDSMTCQHPRLINEFIFTTVVVPRCCYESIIPSSLISWHSSVRKSFPSSSSPSFLFSLFCIYQGEFMDSSIQYVIIHYHYSMLNCLR